MTNLGHPAHPRSKDTGDHNLPEKRGQATSANRMPRKARVVWPRLDCFKSNPDRDMGGPVVMLTQHDVTACRCVRLLRTTSPCGEIPGDDLGRRDEWKGAPRDAVLNPWRSQEKLGEMLLDHLVDLKAKAGGDNSMPEKAGVTRRRLRCRTARSA